VVTQDPAGGTPVCYRHPDRQTLLRCSRCGKSICASCSIDSAVGQRCPDCVGGEGGTQKVVRNPVRVPRRAGTPATMVFIGLAVGFYLVFGSGESSMFEALALINQRVRAGEWWRLFTPVLLHGGLTHLFFNMWALWILGPRVERGVGTAPFAALYLASAGMGGVAFYHFGSDFAVAVGASGAIFGLFGVWLNWALHRRNTAYGRALLSNVLVILAINAALPLVMRGVIAWQAHLGGLVAGFVIGEMWSRIRGPNAVAQRTAAAVGVALIAIALVLI
jgi:membrane associated rhomboid family serine protease